MSCKGCGPGESAGGRVDFQYSVKIVCGVITPSDRPANPLPPGRYSTATNVHNPSRCDVATLRWKVAIGLPGLRVGPVSDFADAILGPDEALEIDCSDVMELLKRSGIRIPSYVKGWVIIESPSELDVVAVYGTSTNRDAAAEPVNTLHTERVEPRCLPVCDDFVMDISTGVADWYVKGPGTGAAFAQATLSSALSQWAQPPAGSLWVIPGSLTSDGDYTYRLQFKLCSGFKKPSLDLRLLADYYANVFLNGHQIPPTQTAASGPNFTSLVPFSSNNYFKAGDNELIIIVTNTERLSPTGLLVHGSMTAENGRCPGVPYPLLVCPEIVYYLHTRTFYANPFIGFFVDIDRGTAYGQNGQELGDLSGKVRAEEFGAALQGIITPGTSLQYEVFTKSVSGTTGWVSPPAPGGMAGITGPDHAITGLRIRLVNAPVHCHVRYSVATRPRLAKWDPNVTWGPDIYDWGTAGTTASIGWPGQYPPIVAVKVQIV